jgi:F-type H+-transporting ATPase subunit e
MAEGKPSSVPAGMTLTRQTAFVTQKAPSRAPPKPLLPPAAISPLIRFSRWTALIAGLTYGMYRTGRLEKKEERLHEIEEKKRPALEAAHAREKMIKTREEMLTLAKQVGVEVPASFNDDFKVPDYVVATQSKH